MPWYKIRKKRHEDNSNPSLGARSCDHILLSKKQSTSSPGWEQWILETIVTIYKWRRLKANACLNNRNGGSEQWDKVGFRPGRETLRAWTWKRQGWWRWWVNSRGRNSKPSRQASFLNLSTHARLFILQTKEEWEDEGRRVSAEAGC